MFVGPTGVGKTETAKALAEILFGAPDRLLRFDMSEFMVPSSVARLFGDLHHPDGELTRRVHQQPFSVVLLDEIEKAHPAVFDALLQVLGEGRLTNAAGRTVSFQNTIIIMTSNLGVRERDKRLGFEKEAAGALVTHFRSAAERHFRPEFFNRIDRVVAFDALGRDAIVPLVKRLITQMLGRRGLKRSNVVVDVDPRIVDLIIDEGFDAKYGARSIKRVLERQLAVPLARHLVTHRSSDLTLVDLFASSKKIEMQIQWPEDSPHRRLEGVDEGRSWSELTRAFESARARLERLTESGPGARIFQEHTDLLERFNRGELESQDRDRMSALSSLAVNSANLTRALDDFEERYLTIEHFEEVLEVDDRPEHHAKEWKATKDIVAYGARPVRLDRAGAISEARQALRALELPLAALSYRVEASASPDEPAVLIRVLQITPDSSWFGHRIANAIQIAWSGDGPDEGDSWGAASLYFREAGKWQPSDDVTLEADAFAVELSGPGAARFVERELGLWLEVRELGPDVVTHLVRVESIGDGGDAIERLQTLDSEIESRRQRRVDGEDISVLPPLPLRRRFDNGSSEDPETGVRFDTLTPERLGEAIERAVVLRMLAAPGGRDA